MTIYKTITMYELCVYTGNGYSRRPGTTLRTHARARKLAKYLRQRHGISPFISPLKITKAV